MFKAYWKAINESARITNSNRAKPIHRRHKQPEMGARPAKTLSSWLKDLVIPGRKAKRDATRLAKEKQEPIIVPRKDATKINVSSPTSPRRHAPDGRSETDTSESNPMRSTGKTGALLTQPHAKSEGPTEFITEQTEDGSWTDKSPTSSLDSSANAKPAQISSFSVLAETKGKASEVLKNVTMSERLITVDSETVGVPADDKYDEEAEFAESRSSDENVTDSAHMLSVSEQDDIVPQGSLEDSIDDIEHPPKATDQPELTKGMSKAEAPKSGIKPVPTDPSLFSIADIDSDVFLDHKSVDRTAGKESKVSHGNIVIPDLITHPVDKVVHDARPVDLSQSKSKTSKAEVAKAAGTVVTETKNAGKPVGQLTKLVTDALESGDFEDAVTSVYADVKKDFEDEYRGTGKEGVFRKMLMEAAAKSLLDYEKGPPDVSQIFSAEKNKKFKEFTKRMNEAVDQEILGRLVPKQEIRTNLDVLRKRLPPGLSKSLTDRQVRHLWADIGEMDKAVKGGTVSVRMEKKIHRMNALLRKHIPDELNVTQYDLYLKGYALGRRVESEAVNHSKPRTLCNELRKIFSQLPGGIGLLPDYWDQLTLDGLWELALKLPDAAIKEQFQNFMTGARQGLLGN